MINQDLVAQLQRLERQTLIRLYKRHISRAEKYGPTNDLVQRIYEKLMSIEDGPHKALANWLDELEKIFLPITKTSWISAGNPHLINFIWLMMINKRAAELFNSLEPDQQLSSFHTRYINNYSVIGADNILERQDAIFSLIDSLSSLLDAIQLVERLERSWGFVERLVPRVPWIENADSEQALYISEALFRIKDKSLSVLRREYLECFRIEEYNIAIYSLCAASIFPLPSETMNGRSAGFVLKTKAAALKKHIAKVRKSFNQRLKRQLASKEQESVRFSYKNFEKLRLLSKFYRTTPKAFLNRLITQAYKEQIDVHQHFLSHGDRVPFNLHNLYDLTQPASKIYNQQLNPEQSSINIPFSPRFTNKAEAQSHNRDELTDGETDATVDHNVTFDKDLTGLDYADQPNSTSSTQVKMPIEDDYSI